MKNTDTPDIEIKYKGKANCQENYPEEVYGEANITKDTKNHLLSILSPVRIVLFIQKL